MKIVKKLFLPTISLFALISCSGEGTNGESDGTDTNELVVVDEKFLEEDQSLTSNINGKIFSIPSPIQMVSLLKNQDDVFNELLLTDPKNVENFTTTYKRAVNMGVYGADLGYATVYEKNMQAVSYLNSVDKLSAELGIAGAFDGELVQRFIDNGNNQDSMLVIMSEGYRKGDQFLKDNEQHDVASLILTGGWIESLYFATSIFDKTKDQEVANRIGEQKTALKTIVDLLNDFNAEGEYTELIEDLTDLKTDFDEIQFNYEYVEPVIDEKNCETHIRSKSSVQIEGKVLDNIVKKVKAIRTALIG
ncbi:hypothetical protein [Crocinitomix algicola]|uniref:hypothetical protein n=1 Tax=Crocinitomix algicola TaxID=1740263 RepID=UPI00082B3627|nr:hypothetical protein [Crocinitomix algicola]